MIIPHNKPTIGTQEHAAVKRVIESGWVAQGREVEAFEIELCEFFGLPLGHALVVSSGSSALYLALWALQTRGLRIGVPVYSCTSLRNAVGLIGGDVVYLDCAKGSPNVNSFQALESAVDVLIAPSMFGIPASFIENSGCKIIEDLAQALGAKSHGQLIGLRGDLGICSFYATKLITSGGQGGAVISRDKSLIDLIKDYREFDCRADSKLRFNFQMTDMQAAVGRSQLGRFSEFIQRREALFSVYHEAGLNLLSSNEPLDHPVPYRAVVCCADPGRVIDALAMAGVKAIVPIEVAELLDEPNLYPAAESLAQTTVSLPLYPGLTIKDARRIAQIVKEAV